MTARERQRQEGLRTDPAYAGVRRLAEQLQQEVERRCGPCSTFEQRRDAARGAFGDALWLEEDRDLHALVVATPEIEVEGTRYRRLEQPSSATYYGWFGSHFIEEPLYREAGVRNGSTVKPIELRVGIVEHMTPDLARVVGELGAGFSSRELERTLRVTGLAPPSRSFLEKRGKQVATEIADAIVELESAARQSTSPPTGVASLSCGLDRMSVRMTEPASASTVGGARTRTEPYERTPPPPKEHRWRKAWVGSVTAYDAQGEELHTWRHGMDADGDPDTLAQRVAADVDWLLRAHPGIPVHCIQDAAPELRALPEALARTLPPNTQVRELIDFEHLMGYLDAVVDACEPPGDPENWKLGYRRELLRRDGAIDWIWNRLRRIAKSLPAWHRDSRAAVAKALSYIRKRKAKMRYASLDAASLPIGSGATESTCWQMQRRVKQPGQSWEVPGLRGVLVTRGLVLSERWATAWPTYAATHRADVRIAA